MTSRSLSLPAAVRATVVGMLVAILAVIGLQEAAAQEGGGGKRLALVPG